MAHQASKLSGSERDELIRRIEIVEYEIFSLPRASKTIYLDLPVSIAQSLIASKAKRSYTDRAADMHEADASYLNNVRQVYRQLMEEVPGERLLIACSRDDAVRSREDIAAEIWSWLQVDLPFREPS